MPAGDPLQGTAGEAGPAAAAQVAGSRGCLLRGGQTPICALQPPGRPPTRPLLETQARDLRAASPWALQPPLRGGRLCYKHEVAAQRMETQTRVGSLEHVKSPKTRHIKGAPRRKR